MPQFNPSQEYQSSPPPATSGFNPNAGYDSAPPTPKPQTPWTGAEMSAHTPSFWDGLSMAWRQHGPSGVVEHLWDKLNTPIPNLLEDPNEKLRQEKNYEKSLPADQKAFLAKKRADAAQWSATHPVADEVARRVTGLGSSLISPLGVGTMGIGALPKVVGTAAALAFGVQAGAGVASGAGHAIHGFATGNTREAAGGTTDAIINALFAGMSAHSLAPEEPPPANLSEPWDTHPDDQMDLPFSGNIMPEPPAQMPLDFGQLPEQRIAQHVPTDSNGQMRLFPNEGQQLELRPEDRPAARPEGPSAQTAFDFPEGPWQLPLDFNQKPTEPTPKWSNANPYFTEEEWNKQQRQQIPEQPTELTPSLQEAAPEAPPTSSEPTRPETPPTETPATPAPKKKGNVNLANVMEQGFRPVVDTIKKLAQLKQAGEDRMHVGRAVDASTENLFSQEDLDSFKEQGWTPPKPQPDKPFIDSTADYNDLDGEEKARVDAVAKHLEVHPGSLQGENGEWRLTPDEYDKLNSMLEAGKRPDAKGEIQPLAHINPANAAAAGLTNARSLRELMSPEDRARLEAEEAATPSKYNPDSEEQIAGGGDAGSFTRKVKAGEQAERAEAGLSTLGLSDANSLGLNTDNPALQEARLRGYQGVLQQAIERGTSALNDKVPAWAQARSGTSKPSKLAQEIAALPDYVKANFPKELYDEKHVNPSTAKGSESAVPKEPIQSTEATTQPSSPKSSNESAKSQSNSGDVLGKIHKLVEGLRQDYGDEVAGALPKLLGAVREKFTTQEYVEKALYGALRKYKAHLDNGVADPLEQAIADTIDKYKGESGVQGTVYSNPLGEIYNRSVRLTKPLGAELPAGTDPPAIEHPIQKLMDKMSTGPERTAWQKLGNWANTEAVKAMRIAQELSPDDLMGKWQAVKAGFDTIKQQLKNPVELWKNWRFKLNSAPSTFQYLKFERNLSLLESSIRLQDFNKKLLDAIPDKMERSGFAVWAEAHRGPAGPVEQGKSMRLSDAEAEKVLQQQLAYLEARPRGKNSYEAKVWRAALQLKPESKAFIKNYNDYDALMGKQDEDAGVPHEMLEDYWQHIWKQPGVVKSITNAFKQSVGWQTKGSFQKMRTQMTYFDGIKAGLKPVDLDAAYLIGNRANASAKVIANRQFIEGLETVPWTDGTPIAKIKGVGSPSGTEGSNAAFVNPQASRAQTADGRSYITSSHPSLRQWKWSTTAPDGSPVFHLGEMEIHPDAWKQMKADFEQSWWRTNPLGRAAMKANVFEKTAKLSYSIFHPVALEQHAAARTALGALRGNMPSLELPDGSKIDPSLRMLNPWDSKFKIDMEDPKQRMGVLAGLALQPENIQSMYGSAGAGIRNIPFAGGVAGIVHDYTIHSIIPKFAMGTYLTNFDLNTARYYEDFVGRHLKEMGYDSVSAAPQTNVKVANDRAMWQIARMSAKQANYSNGLTPLTDLPGFRGATAADTARFFLLAPQFLFNRGMLMLDAAKPGGAQTFQAMALQGMATFAFCYAVNRQTQGDDWQPDIHNWNKIVVGKEGEPRHEYVMRSELSDAIDLAENPRRFIQYRLAPDFRPVADAVTGKDAYGNPITKSQIMLDTVTAGAPIPIEGFADMLAPHYDAALRASKGSDAALNGISAAIGWRRGEYRTPAQRAVSEDFNSTKAPNTTDDFALEQKAEFRNMRDAYRNGTLTPDMIQDAINNPNGNLKASELPYLFRTATQTQMQTQAEHLEFHQVQKAWQLGSQLEKYELTPILMRKIATLPPMMQQSEADQLEAFYNTLTPEKQQELENLKQKQIELETRK